MHNGTDSNLEDITIDNFIKDKDGNTYLRYYDKEYKVWMNIYCNPNNSNGLEELTSSLKQLYLNKYKL